MQALRTEKMALEKQKESLERALKEGGQSDAATLAEREKRVTELEEQIKNHKSELEKKTEEFQSEKKELQE